MPKIEVLKVKDIKATQASHMDTGAYDKYLLGNVHLGGHPTESLAVVVSVFEPSKGSGMHKHDVEEAFFILRGRGKAIISDKEYQLEPDTLLYAPANVQHDFTNTGDESLVLLAAFSKSTYSCERI